MHPFSRRFLSHLIRFGKRMRLFERTGISYVAVSGGRDSMTLLWCLAQLQKQSIIGEMLVIHMHHGTREGQDADEQLVRDEAMRLGLAYQLCRPLQPFGTSNFEHHARLARYDQFLEPLGPNDRLYLAHHIDDSYEWSMLAQAKSGVARSILGIPVVRGKIRRPFMGVTRSQIDRLIHHEGIVYRDDPTHGDDRFDRNAIRRRVVPWIAQRFPSFLRHYVARSNELARAWGVAREIVGTSLGVHRSARDDQWWTLAPNDEIVNVAPVRESVHRHSSSHRGEIRRQMQKLEQAFRHGKQGPFEMSGGVEIHLMPGHLMVMNTQSGPLYHEMDRRLALRLRTMEVFQGQRYSIDEWEGEIESALNQGAPFPLWTLVLHPERSWPRQASLHRLWPESAHEWQKADLHVVSGIRSLRFWRKQKRLRRAELILVPLWKFC